MKAEKIHILVVDDEEDLCWAIKNALRPSGYVIKSATSGAQALAYLTKDDYKVAFVDAKLPDMDGLNLAALIRQRSPHTKIILISGYYYQEDTAIIESLNNDLLIGFIAKPFDLKEVRQMARLAAVSTETTTNKEDAHAG